MMNIFLAGGGVDVPSRQFDRFFLRHIDVNKKILYVPVAAGDNDECYKDCLTHFKEFYGELGAKNIELFTHLDGAPASPLDEYGGMYISGGNTFYLLDKMRTGGFKKIIGEFLRRGLGVFGTSAGAISLGNDIVPCMHLDPNDIGMTDFTGLDLIGGRSVWCHYIPENDEIIRNYLKTHDVEAVAIPENSGVLYNGETFTPEGPDQVFLFHGDKKTKLV